MDGAGAGAKQKRAADADAATANAPLLNLSDDVFREVLACVPADDLIILAHLDHAHSRTHLLVGEALTPTTPRGGVAAEPSSTGGGNPGGGRDRHAHERRRER